MVSKKLFIVRSNKEKDDETGEPLYWSNDDGWVDKDSATTFSKEEVEDMMSVYPDPTKFMCGSSWEEI